MIVPRVTRHPSGRFTVMIKTIDNVYPVYESRLPKPLERRIQQYIVPN
jgi:hypothetical protein